MKDARVDLFRWTDRRRETNRVYVDGAKIKIKFVATMLWTQLARLIKYTLLVKQLRFPLNPVAVFTPLALKTITERSLGWMCHDMLSGSKSGLPWAVHVRARKRRALPPEQLLSSMVSFVPPGTPIFTYAALPTLRWLDTVIMADRLNVIGQMRNGGWTMFKLIRKLRNAYGTRYPSFPLRNGW